MNIEEIWLANFKAVVSAEIAKASNAAEGYRRVAAQTGLGYDYIYQIYKDKPAHKPKRPSIDVMTTIGRAYGEGKPDHWFNLAPSEMLSTPSATQPSSAQGSGQATITPFPATTLDAVMERLSHYLAQVPHADRGQSSAALAALALQPEDFARKTRHLRSLIEPADPADETATGTDPAPK